MLQRTLIASWRSLRRSALRPLRGSRRVDSAMRRSCCAARKRRAGRRALLGAQPRSTSISARPMAPRALHWAVYHNDVALVDRLHRGRRRRQREERLRRHADVRGRGRRQRRRSSRKLLAAGADVESANADGQTALMVIARTSNVEAAKLLLDHGANVNARRAVARPDRADVGRGRRPARDGEAADRARRGRQCALAT